MGVWEKLAYRIERLRFKYPDSERKALARLGVWCFRALLKPRRFYAEEPTFPTRALRSSLDAARADGRFRVLFLLRGGLGDLTIASTYLKEWAKYIDCDALSLTLGSTKNLDASRSIFRAFPPTVEAIDSVERFETASDLDGAFDAIVELMRVPELRAWNRETTAFFSPKAAEYWTRLEAAQIEQPKLFTSNSTFDFAKVAFALANGKTRRSQPDFDGTLGMNAATRLFSTFDESATQILRERGLENRVYATLQRGVDETSQSEGNVRLWPVERYNALIAKIKSRFPEICVVQLGKREANSDLRGVDLDLRGETTFEELKAILKYSALHIDGECGMTHFKRALNGRSAVFFAQTSVEFCGYPENINVAVEGACPICCEWVSDNWQNKCLRGFSEPPCMSRLTTELFFDAICPTLEEAIKRPGVVWERVERKENASDGATGGAGEKKTLLFVGDFSEERVASALRQDVDVVWLSTRLTTSRLASAKRLGIDADWADALNLPMKDESCDAAFCADAEPSRWAKRELARVLKANGEATFGVDGSGGVWRKTLESAGEREKTSARQV